MGVVNASSWIHGIYAITPVAEGAWSWTDVLACSEALLDGGIRLMQFRQKGWSIDLWSQRARELGKVCDAYGAALILNDAPAQAQLKDWPGVKGIHLGREDMPVAEARLLWGAEILIGASCYNQAALARQAVEDGADHIAFGALYPSSTKPAAVRAELSLFEQSAGLGVPSVGIGGIEYECLGEIAKAGASAVAVVSALYGSEPNAQACQERARSWAQEWIRLRPDVAISNV